MNTQGRGRRVSGVVVTAILGGLLWWLSAQPALAATGDLLRTIDLVGTSADCGTSGGTSVALVPGGRVGFDQDQFPVLLVTTCIASGNTTAAKNKRSTLYFVDPAASPSLRVPKTILISPTAASPGYASGVYRANKADVLLCHADGSLYSVNIGAFTTTTPTLLFRPTTACTAVAWDPTDKTIYMSNGTQIFHVNSAGNQVAPPFAAPTSPTTCTTVRGLAIVGGVLLVTCDGSPSVVRRLDKTSNTNQLLTADPTVTFTTSPLVDLECDPKTFGSATGEINVLWSKNPAANQVRAFRVPAGTCGLPPTATVLAPAACPGDFDAVTGQPKYLNSDGSPKDTDGDGLWDCWEDGSLWSDGKPGIDFNNSGTSLATRPIDISHRDLTLCANVVTGAVMDSSGHATAVVTQECTDRNRKDIWVEIDFMENADGSSSHRPDPLALISVRTAFANAPVDTNGIAIHFQVDERIQHVDGIAFEPCTSPAPNSTVPDFDGIKSGSSTFGGGFGTASERANLQLQTINAKWFAFRYMIFAHNQVGSTASGCGERPGNDTLMTLASFTSPAPHPNGTTAEQGAVVMHEIGHNLGLGHGGGDDNNCKPNYLSVMNYTFIFPDYVNLRPLDYSRAKLDDLTKGSLSEPLGIGPEQSPAYLNGTQTVYLPLGAVTPLVKTLVVDPTTNRAPIDWNNNGFATDPTVNAPDINKLVSASCNGSGTVLTGHNDWANLQYNGRVGLDFVPDKSASAEQSSWESADSDGDGVGDALSCNGPCVIDILPQENPNIVNVGQNSNIRVAWLSTPTFSAPLEVDATKPVTLNGAPCFPSANVGSHPNVQDVNQDGRPDLVFRCDTAGLEFGTNLAVLEGFTTSGHPARGRDFIAVTNP